MREERSERGMGKQRIWEMRPCGEKKEDEKEERGKLKRV